MTHKTLADGQNTNTTCKRDKLLVVNYVKFHLTIFNINRQFDSFFDTTHTVIGVTCAHA